MGTADPELAAECPAAQGCDRKAALPGTKPTGTPQCAPQERRAGTHAEVLSSLPGGCPGDELQGQVRE